MWDRGLSIRFETLRLSGTIGSNTGRVTPIKVPFSLLWVILKVPTAEWGAYEETLAWLCNRVRSSAQYKH